MNITFMTEQDIASVYQIECEVFSKPWSKASFLESIENKKNIYLVAKEDEEIIGYCGLWGIIDEGHITNVAVKKSCQGKGIGKEMLKKLLEFGRGKGLVAFTLEVRVSNMSAIRLYHSLGFLDAGIRRNFYEDPIEDGLIMWLHNV